MSPETAHRPAGAWSSAGRQEPQSGSGRVEGQRGPGGGVSAVVRAWNRGYDSCASSRGRDDVTGGLERPHPVTLPRPRPFGLGEGASRGEGGSGRSAQQGGNVRRGDTRAARRGPAGHQNALVNQAPDVLWTASQCGRGFPHGHEAVAQKTPNLGASSTEHGPIGRVDAPRVPSMGLD